jgi:transcriptional regulator with XRE-family HTH domain
MTGFGNRMRFRRTELGLTLAQLAEATGLHLQSLSRLERGEREPTWETVLKLSKALRWPTDAFLTESELADRGPLDPPPAEEPPAPKRTRKPKGGG